MIVLNAVMNFGSHVYGPNLALGNRTYEAMIRIIWIVAGRSVVIYKYRSVTVLERIFHSFSIAETTTLSQTLL